MESARARLFALPKSESDLVNIDGVEVLIDPPSVKDRSEVTRLSKKGDSIDMAEFQVHSVIRLCRDPLTSEPIFTLADRETLLKMPAGGFLDKLSEKCIAKMNVVKTPEEVEKN